MKRALVVLLGLASSLVLAQQPTEIAVNWDAPELRAHAEAAAGLRDPAREPKLPVLVSNVALIQPSRTESQGAAEPEIATSLVHLLPDPQDGRPRGYAFTATIGDITIGVDAQLVAVAWEGAPIEAPAIPPDGVRVLAQAAGEGEEVHRVEVEVVRYGVPYLVFTECQRADDERCLGPDFTISLVDTLIIAGGAP